MFCPSCGEQNNLEQKFCRKCGINLEQTAMSVREQSLTLPAELTKQEQLLAKFGSIAFGGLGVVVLAGILGIIYAIFANMVSSGRRPYTGILLIAFVIFAALALAYVFWNEMLKEKRAKFDRGLREEMTRDMTSRTLTDGAVFEPVPSVTERTTDLLDRPRSKRGVTTGKIS